MKQRLERKNIQHFIEEVSLLTDMRLKENDGTHNTSTKVRESDNLIVPVCVTKAYSPLGSSTVVCKEEVILVNKVIEQIIWSVAPISMIQVL